MRRLVPAIALIVGALHIASAQTAAPGPPTDHVSAPDGINFYITPIPGTDSDGSPSAEIQEGVYGNSKFQVLLKSHSSDTPEKNLTGLSNLFLSPDDRTLYFETAAWATSGAVHALDIVNEKVSYVTDGEIACVVLAGEYQGDLVVQQHKYFVQGGSYDDLWLYDPTGKQIGLVSQDTDASRVCPTLGN